ncbi:MAG: tRNA (N(6)-L-threonylcarbamoyladenosine(37)-C(2))-methylthiotransferase MtaB [Bacilli bacterium]|nr:tRNA (N(6)-L-threonylcarbamoyladenosine(37)-C(2))-methylthiotransferase MtaB [Bacilli bacterium]
MKVGFYTLGCKVNMYETEVLINLFKQNKYEIVSFDETADIYVINTCTVTNTSDKKSRQIIRRAIKQNNKAIIIVMGCYSQIRSKEIKEIDGVDIIIGTNDRMKILEYIDSYKKDLKQIDVVNSLDKVMFEDMEITNFETKTRAFVKIQDGCNNYCTYCIIPYTRGDIRSKDKDKIIKEITNLVNNGYKEVVLTGIHTGHYGIDLLNYDLSDLLTELINIKGLLRIRLSSIEITEINNKLLNLLKSSNIIADHLHIPLQAGSNKILKDMNRKYDREYFYNKIKEIRLIRPNISITTDVIVGFPGECEEDFNDTYKFIEEVNFTSLHVFPYSKREGTKASLMDNQVDTSIKKARVKKLMDLSNDLELKYMNRFINKELDIIIENYEKNITFGHSSNYLKVKVDNKPAKAGDILKVTIKKIEYPYCIGLYKS